MQHAIHIILTYHYYPLGFLPPFYTMVTAFSTFQLNGSLTCSHTQPFSTTLIHQVTFYILNVTARTEITRSRIYLCFSTRSVIQRTATKAKCTRTRVAGHQTSAQRPTTAAGHDDCLNRPIPLNSCTVSERRIREWSVSGMG